MTVFAVHIVLGGYTVENRGEKEVITKTVIERDILDGTIPEIMALHVPGNPFVHAAVFSVTLLTQSFALLHHERNRRSISPHTDGNRRRTSLGPGIFGYFQTQQRFACHTRIGLHFAPVSRTPGSPIACGGKRVVKHPAFDLDLVFGTPGCIGDSIARDQLFIVAARHAGRQHQQYDQHPSE